MALRDHRLSLKFLSLCDFLIAASTSKSKSSSGVTRQMPRKPDDSVYARFSKVKGCILEHLRFASCLKSTVDNRLPVPFSRSGVQGEETSCRNKSCVFLSGEGILNTSSTPKSFRAAVVGILRLFPVQQVGFESKDVRVVSLDLGTGTAVA